MVSVWRANDDYRNFVDITIKVIVMSEWIIELDNASEKNAVLQAKKITELVRCEDCRHFDGQELCLKHGFFVGLDLTFFCKSGERKNTNGKQIDIE